MKAAYSPKTKPLSGKIVELIRLAIIRFSQPKVLGLIVTLVIVVKTPGIQMLELAKVLFHVGDEKTGLSTIGWVAASAGWLLALAFLVTTPLLVYLMRQSHKDEMNRLVAERDRLQGVLTNRPIQHSESPRKESEL